MAATGRRRAGDGFRVLEADGAQVLVTARIIIDGIV
jgi:hypothetical protein